jgi:hypothetical protein
MSKKILLIGNVPKDNDATFNDYDNLGIRDAFLAVMGNTLTKGYTVVNVKCIDITPLLNYAAVSLDQRSELQIVPDIESTLEHSDYKAGFFIGGDQEIVDAYNIFKAANPSVPLFSIATTGGASKVLHQKEDGLQNEELSDMLGNSKRYGALIRKCLDYSKRSD